MQLSTILSLATLMVSALAKDCSPYDTKCDGNNLLKCADAINLNWEHLSTCSRGCTDKGHGEAYCN